MWPSSARDTRESKRGLACARMGLSTVVFTINLDAVGNMPCNPAIGGTGKGHLVRELDALGGEMAKAADRCCIQYRMLNLGKGPAVHSLRAQADRRKYQEDMKHTLERQENLDLKQAMVVSIGLTDGHVSSVTTRLGAVYDVKAVVIASGTYLDARVITGDCAYSSGPDGMQAGILLTDCLKAFGLRMRRFKTGTPPRVNRRSVDVSKMELQPGDAHPEPFSFSTTGEVQNQAVCYLTYTNEETHRIIRENFARSPLFNGMIESVGPRVLPVDRDENRPLSGKNAPSALCGTLRTRDGRTLHSGPFVKSSRGCADRDGTHNRGTRARGDHAPGVRD